MHISYLKVSASRESGSEQKMKKKPKKNPENKKIQILKQILFIEIKQNKFNNFISPRNRETKLNGYNENTLSVRTTASRLRITISWKSFDSLHLTA